MVDPVLVLRGEAGEIEDPDLAAKTEREINRLWAALHSCREECLIEAEGVVRNYLDSPWPELRIEALQCLCSFGDVRAIERAYALIADADADETERREAEVALDLVPVSEADRPQGSAAAA